MNPLIGYAIGLALIVGGILLSVFAGGWVDERRQRRADREYPPTTHRR